MQFHHKVLLAALLLSATPALAADPPATPTGPLPKQKFNIGAMLKKLFAFTTPAERSEALLPPTYAFKSPTSGMYVTQLAGIIARPSTPKVMLNALISMIERQFGLLQKGRSSDAMNFRKKISLILCVPTIGQVVAGVTWKHGDERTRNSLPPPSARVESDGSFLSSLVRIPPSVKPGDSLEFQLYEDSRRAWTGYSRIHTIQPTGWTIVSDIDDTLRNTGVLDPKTTFKTTFTEAYKSLPNTVSALNTLQKKLSAKDSPAAVHYLTGSPIALLPALHEWLTKDGFPAGPIELHKTTLNSFVNAKKLQQVLEYKVGYLARLARDFPQRRFVLIGDSTQSDPEAYATMYRDVVKKGMKPPCIYIRLATGVNAAKEAEKNKKERFLWDFRDVNTDHWMLYTDAAELKLVDPTSGSCYPKGKKNPNVASAEVGKLTRPAVTKDNKPMVFKEPESSLGSSEFDAIYEVLAPYYAKFAGMLQ